MSDKIFIEELAIGCKIGIFDWERKIKQKILVDMEFPANIRKAAKRDRIQDAVDYKKITKHALEFVGKSQYFLIETLAEDLARTLIKTFKLSQIKLRVSKPGALRNSKNVGVEILRKRK